MNARQYYLDRINDAMCIVTHTTLGDIARLKAQKQALEDEVAALLMERIPLQPQVIEERVWV